MSLDLVIRSATENDENMVVALWHACGLTVSYNDPAKDFCFALGKSASDILVGTIENKIVGSAMVGHDGHRGWVYYVATDPEVRLQGIGRCMIEAAESWLRQRNVPKIMLMVRETNTSVIDFYKHLDFEEAPRVILQKWLIKKAD